MDMKEVRRSFDRYQNIRNTYIAKQSAKSKVMCSMTDTELDEIFKLMTSFYDFGYNQALNDCIALNSLDFPNNLDYEEI